MDLGTPTSCLFILPRWVSGGREVLPYLRPVQVPPPSPSLPGNPLVDRISRTKGPTGGVRMGIRPQGVDGGPSGVDSRRRPHGSRSGCSGRGSGRVPYPGHRSWEPQSNWVWVGSWTGYRGPPVLPVPSGSLLGKTGVRRETVPVRRTRWGVGGGEYLLPLPRPGSYDPT